MAGYSSAEDLQRILGAPVTITSGDRSPQKNRLVGGVPNSAHLKPGMAVDFVPQGISTKDAAAKLAKAGLPFDQIIDENDHVHVSQDPRNRQQVLGPKVANVSDADLLNMMGGASKEVAPSKAANVSDGQLLSVMGGDSSAPASPGSPRQAPAGAAPGGKPSYMGKEFGFGEEMAAHMPFGKDVAAGVPALLDTLFGPQKTLSDLVTGKENTFGSRYRQNLADYNAAQQGYEGQNPGMSPLAMGTGILASGGPAQGAISGGVQTLGQLMKSGAKGGATLGGLFGVGEAAPSLDERAGNAAKGAAVGAGIGGALPVAGAIVRPVGRALGATVAAITEKLGITNPDQKARAENLLLKAMERDQTSATEIATALSGADGKPLTAMDVGGTNMKRQARNLVTQPGEAGDKVTKFLGERAENQSGRVLGDIKSHLSSNTDVYGLAENLTKERAATAAPLYKEAFEGGSLAPLEDQFRAELMTATGAKGTLAKQIKQIETEKAGALAARGAAGADTRAKYMELQDQLKQSESARQQANEIFQKAKADGSANAPGAVWNPRIQQFLDDPIIKQGINKGLEVQRLEALAEGKAFNPTEYAVVGQNADGTAKVGTVPNMRLLDSAKRGLDEILEGYRDGVTGKLNLDQRGRAIEKVRQSLLKELDAINPKYKEARAAWAGPSQSNTAMSMGEKFLKADKEEIQQAFSRLSDADKDFYRVGAARALQDKARSAADSADLSKRLFGNAQIREQIETVFGKGSADKFAKAMGSESEMAHTGRFVLGGSNTANKFADAEDSHLELAQDIMHGFMHGGPKGAAALGAYGSLKRGINNLFTGMNPETANHLAKALTEHGEGAGAFYQGLAKAQAARSAKAGARQGAGRLTNRLITGAAAQSAVRSNQQ